MIAERTTPDELRRALCRIYPFLSFERIPSRDGGIDLVPTRITSKCNQRCPFCQAIDPQPEDGPPWRTIEAAMERIARALPGAKIVITGGEPTLRQDLVALLGALLALEGLGAVEVQTNAVRVGRSPERFPFPRSEKLGFLVAFHGATPAVYDAATGTTGQLPHAIAGIQALLGAGHDVELNCVISAINIDHLAGLPATIAPWFDERQRPRLHFSIMGIPEHRDVAALLVPYPAMLRELERAQQAARGFGFPTSAALSAGHAAVPPCLLPSPGQLQPESRYAHEQGSERAASAYWAKGPPCDDCTAGDACWGLPRCYVERFGFDELRPILNALR